MIDRRVPSADVADQWWQCAEEGCLTYRQSAEEPPDDCEEHGHAGWKLVPADE